MKIIAPFFYSPSSQFILYNILLHSYHSERNKSRNNGSDEHERKRILITSIIDTNNVKLCESFCSERAKNLSVKELGRARKK